jgi:hypothetical protein
MVAVRDSILVLDTDWDLFTVLVGCRCQDVQPLAENIVLRLYSR